MESELKKKDKLLEESEKKATCLEEEYEYIGLIISYQGDSPYEKVEDTLRLAEGRQGLYYS